MLTDPTSIPLSILDLSPIVEGDSPRQALRNTLAFAQAADRHDFKRFWVAEHHNMPGIASAATSVVSGYVAAGTERIRVGAGGVMLPNHASLVIAEQFGTLEALYPGRIDLGLGRAPGTDQRTAAALRRNFGNTDDTFPLDLAELQSYFAPASPSLAALTHVGRLPAYRVAFSHLRANLREQFLVQAGVLLLCVRATFIIRSRFLGLRDGI